MKMLRCWWVWMLLAAAPLAAQPNCTFTLAPASASVAATTFPIFQGSFRVDASANNCARTAVSNVNWLTVQLGQSGTGDGLVGYAVENNLTPQARSGTISVGNAVFTVTQAANSCRTTLGLQGGPSNIGNEGGTRILTVETTCQWRVVSNVDWITIAEPNGATGNGSVQLNIARNTTANPRTGVASVGINGMVINQASGTCNHSFATPALQALATGGTLTADLTATCDWTARSNAAWISVTPTSGTGSARLTLTVQRNEVGNEGRRGHITAGMATLAVDQPPIPCDLQFSPASGEIGAAGGTGTFSVVTNCPGFGVTPNVPWVRVSTAGIRVMQYTVEPNPDAAPRTALIRSGSTTFTLVQAGASCSYTVTPTLLEIPAAGGRGSIGVSSGSGCAWTAVSDAGWFRLGAVVVGQSVAWEADANPAGDARTATVTIGSRALPVRQLGAANAPRIAAAGVVSAADYAGGRVAPGEIVAIFGENVGPAALVSLTLGGDGKVTKELGGVRVLFDGIPAPLIYVSAGQLSAVVPYAVAGRGQVNLQTEYQGVRSNTVALPVLDAKPALFSADSTGRGPGAILNEDGSVNSPANPARPGSIVILFGTGEGLPNPLPEDGTVTGALPLPRPVLTPRATVGGQTAEVLYAGSAPGLVAGVLQMNLRLPSGLEPRAHSVRIYFGAYESGPAVSVAVR